MDDERDLIIYFNGVDKTLLNKFNIVISPTSKIENGTKIYQNVCILNSIVDDDCVIFPNTILDCANIGKGCTIKSSIIENSSVGEGSNVGPFAHVHSNCKIGQNCRVGNFVEVKNSCVGAGSKMAHLTYVGDSEIGEDCNIGCGVIFCNYDGKNKHGCKIGNRVFIGSNVNLIAPVKIGDEAYIAAGSTINEDVKCGEFAIARERQTNKQNANNPYIEKFKNK